MTFSLEFHNTTFSRTDALDHKKERITARHEGLRLTAQMCLAIRFLTMPLLQNPENVCTRMPTA